MAFTLTQSIKAIALTGTEESPTVTFDSGATAGNLIVVALGHRRVDASATPVISGAGSTGLTRHYAYTDNTNGNKGVALFSKIATGGETEFISVHTQQWRYIAAAEFTVPAGTTGVTWHNHATAVANTAATTLTVGVPNPSTADSLAWASTFARDQTVASSFDSGFSAATFAHDFSVSWRADAASTPGNNVTATYDTSRIAIMGSGVWVAEGISNQLATPTNFSFTAHGSLRQLNGSWTAVANAGSYEASVDYETDPDTWVNLTTYAGAATSFQLTDADGVAWGTKYRCRVRAIPA
jgi:hypothetical protein